MLPKTVKVQAWLPVLIWMTAIFIGSTNVLSSQHTSRFIGPFLRWLNPGISDARIQQVQYAVRKCGHLSEYALLALLLRRALHLSTRTPWTAWDGPKALASIGMAGLYAVTDEFHQSFVSTRYASALDVLIDTTGAALALALLWLFLTFRSRLRSDDTDDADVSSVPSR